MQLAIASFVILDIYYRYVRVKISHTVWCTVLLDNHQEEVVHSRKLESETGRSLSLQELTLGAEVLFNHKGLRYRAQLVSVTRKYQLFLCCN